jgi:hypothetical protein
MLESLPPKEELMPIHDWSRVYAGLFHHFHQQWTCKICDALNAERLPKGYAALIEQSGAGIYPELVGFDRSARLGRMSDVEGYAAKANRIAIHHPLQNVVAVIEILSLGNKNSRRGLRMFVQKSLDCLQRGDHLVIIDLFPPSRHDPRGIHPAIWDEISEVPFALPANRPLTVASYCSGESKMAFVNQVAVGELLPDMPLFLDPDTYVLTPLEAAYLAAWETCPEEFREAVETPAP